MKRIFTLLVVVLLVCGLVVACGGGEKEPEPNGNNDVVNEQPDNNTPETHKHEFSSGDKVTVKSYAVGGGADYILNRVPKYANGETDEDLIANGEAHLIPDGAVLTIMNDGIAVDRGLGEDAFKPVYYMASSDKGDFGTGYVYEKILDISDSTSKDKDEIDIVSGKTLDNLVNHEDYSIEYPNNWEIEEGEDEITLKPMDDEIFSTQINISNMDMPGLSSGDVDELIDETKKQMGDDDMGFEFEKIKFNGYDAMKMSMSIMGISVETYNIPMNGVFVIIAANFDEKTETEVKDILKTFRLK